MLRFISFSLRFLSIALGLLLSACAPVPYPDTTWYVGIPPEDVVTMPVHDHHSANPAKSMASHEAYGNPHWLWTRTRPVTPEDQRKADKIVQTLRSVLPRYANHQVALRHGYRPFLHNVPLFHYHFLSHWKGAKEYVRFDPAEPTAILYRKTNRGFQLEGAMYTAPPGASEDQLHDRIPLSLARWHAHVNLCFPPVDQARNMDWAMFGPHGTIATEEKCDAVGGRWFPRMYGWMIHVFPFAESPEKIWSP